MKTLQPSTRREQLCFRDIKASLFTQNVILSLKSFLVFHWCYLSQFNETNRYLLLLESLSEIDAGTEKEQVGLVYGQTMLMEVGFIFTQKSSLTFSLIKQIICSRDWQILAFLYF